MVSSDARLQSKLVDANTPSVAGVGAAVGGTLDPHCAPALSAGVVLLAQIHAAWPGLAAMLHGQARTAWDRRPSDDELRRSVVRATMKAER